MAVKFGACGGNVDISVVTVCDIKLIILQKHTKRIIFIINYLYDREWACPWP